MKVAECGRLGVSDTLDVVDDDVIKVLEVTVAKSVDRGGGTS